MMRIGVSLHSEPSNTETPVLHFTTFMPAGISVKVQIPIPSKSVREKKGEKKRKGKKKKRKKKEKGRKKKKKTNFYCILNIIFFKSVTILSKS